MKRNGTLCWERKRALCLACSLALSAVLAAPVPAKGSAGRELLLEAAAEGLAGWELLLETAAGETAGSTEEAAQPENGGEDGAAREAGEGGAGENAQNPDGTEHAAADPGESETGTGSAGDGGTDAGDAGGNAEDGGTDSASDMDGPAGRAGGDGSGNAGHGSGEEDGETEETEGTEGTEETEETEKTEETAMPQDLGNAYTDAQGNAFNYILDENGNAVITGIALSGQDLAIPDSINGAAVAAVSGGGSCVVSNPETAVPSLYVNCGSVGAYAFSGLHIGTLTVGEGAARFEEAAGSGGSSHYWRQFAGSTVGKLRFYAPDLAMAHTAGKGLANTMSGPFDGAEIGEIEIGAGVSSIPEYLLYGAKMDIERLEIQASAVGAYAFAGENISIGELAIGSGVTQFLEDYYSSGGMHRWRQFAGASVGKLRFYAPYLAMEHTAGNSLTNSMSGPFDGAKIGEMEIGADVASIPEYLLYGARMEIERLEIHAATVGAYAFAGGSISIGELAIGSEASQFLEDYYSSGGTHRWSQFKDASVGKLRFYAPDLAMAHTAGKGLTNTMSGPFEGARIGSLEIGADVSSIPEYLLYGAEMDIERLEIHAPAVGAYAFAGGSISIGELTVGREVSQFPEDYYSSGTSHHWRQFAGAAVGKLRYEAPDLAVGHTAGKGLTNIMSGPFEGARIGLLEIGAGVSSIPEYLLYGAKMDIERLEIHASTIGAYAFAGGNITIGELAVGREVSQFPEDYYSSGTSHHWRQFADASVGKLRYEALDLAVGHTAGKGLTNIMSGPFDGASVGELEIGADVESIPEYFLYNARFAADALEISVPKIGAYAFAGSGISIGTLTLGRNVAAFAEDYFSTANYHYWNQFMDAGIGHVAYDADSAASENSAAPYGTYGIYVYGPFQRARIGSLAIADNVERIPDYLFYNAEMSLDALSVNAPVIGALAFKGSGISIRTLEIGERVEHLAAAKYSSSSERCWEQFRDAAIGTVNYNAASASLDGSGISAGRCYSPFYKTGIAALNLGGGVEAIPAFLFYEAVLEQEELAIHARTVGSGAFCSPGISIGTLAVGEEVGELSFVKSGSSYYFRQFGGMAVGRLVYEAGNAATGASCTEGPFHNARVGSVSFGSGVEAVPNYLFYNAKIAFGDFTVNAPSVGCYSFSGPGISFGELTVGGNVSSFPVSAGGHSRAFYNSAVEGGIHYNAADARLPTASAGTYGPFSDTAAGSLHIGENVRYLDRRLFRGSRFESCTVDAVTASKEHLGQALSSSYLPTVKCLDIHHNSGFAGYFTPKAEETAWMCRNFFTAIYGDKVLEGESGVQKVEVTRECTVCGYAEGGFEDLDSSHEVRLSIPVEIPLLFSGSGKSYGGSAPVYAYGRLGNAYDGVRLSVDAAAENFGLAEMGGKKVDISACLSAGFSSGSKAVFTPAQVLANGQALSNGDTEGLYTDTLAVSVKGTAFLRSGAGDYAIPIPLKIEIF